ncbi:MAG: DUF1127 domain-containing protein [Beijerinckiaceae bacterium]
MTLTLTTLRSYGSLAHALREAALVATRKFQTFAEARRNRRAVISLAECDDRMLKDIGLTRSEVMGALAVRFGEDPSSILNRDTSVGHRQGLRSDILVAQPRRMIIQGFAQGIA